MKITCIGCNEQLTVVRSMSLGEDVTVRPCRSCGNELARMLAAQREWQIQGTELNRDSNLPDYVFIDPAEPPSDVVRTQYIAYNVLALENELHEMLQETGWKPWSTSNHVNDAALHEWIDAWHFMMNILWAIIGGGTLGDAATLAMTVEDLYARKRGVNVRRQREGYDGVTSKCLNCKRDFGESDCTPEVCNY